MSTGLLYHALGVRGYRHERTEYSGGAIFLRIRRNPSKRICPSCKSRSFILRGGVERTFRSIPIGKKPTFLRLTVHRVQCRECGTLRQEDVEFAHPRIRHTRAFERYALDLTRWATIQDVAEHLDVSWGTVKDIKKRYLQRRFSRPRLKDLRLMAIDEISIGRGHRYLTVVLNLESGAVVFVGKGKGVEALSPFWKQLYASRAKVEAVAMDMSPAYIAAVQDALPKAKIVFDRFHVVKFFNEKLSDLRRDVQREAEDKMHKQVLKGTRWLLLKNPEHLNDDRGERQRLEEALRINKPIATAYYLKEDLRQLWEQADKAEARRFLRDWIRRADASGVRILKDFARTLARHREGLLSWYDYPISTGPLEGTNNKIKTLQRRAYGFRDQAFFTLQILGLHETKYALVG
jgi:transposase